MCGMGRKSAGLPCVCWLTGVGMGTTHAWESFGDNEPPDIQTVAKGLGGGYAVLSLCFLGFIFDYGIVILALAQSLCLKRSWTFNCYEQCWLLETRAHLYGT
jgi:hypothetical protein